jgi:photosynthetic reaction center cytochrome c subunit
MAPERYKNIQVLTDVPADQLDLTMRYVVAATGIQCSGCHVADSATGQLQPEKDDRPAKKTARQMMSMVNTINAGNFGARVSCGTCHAGRNQPPGLALAAMLTPDQVAALAQQAAAAAARQGAPGQGAPGGSAANGRGGRGAQTPPVAVDVVLAKYFEALGGRAAIEKIQSVTINGTHTDRASQSTPYVIEEKGAKFRETVQSHPDALTRAFDGTAGWEQRGGRRTILQDFPLQQLLRSAELGLPLRLASATNLQAGRAMRLPALGPAGSPLDVNVLQYSPQQYVTEQLMFDAASGLLVREVARTATGLRGQLIEQFDYSDYRDVGGVKMPFQVIRANWNTFDTLKASEIKTNVTIDDARFSMPPN